MSAVNQNFITTPVGRLVWGSISKPKMKDSKGNPLVHKSGPDIGKPAPRYEFGIAIEKHGEAHWNQTAWGRQIWDAAVAAWPAGQSQRPDFSWKITDGDSAIQNKKGVAPRTRQGHPGHWVLAFSSSFAPDVLDATGRSRVDAEMVKSGYFIQVAGSVKGSNGNADSPGVYLNSKFVSFQAYGPEIVNGPDPSTLGFGQAQLPAGASSAPVTSTFVPPAQTAPAAPVVPVAPVVVTPTPVAPVAPMTPAPVVVTPHTSILNPPAPPAPPTGPQLTAKAQGASYAQLLAAGWTDATLRSEGLMV